MIRRKWNRAGARFVEEESNGRYALIKMESEIGVERTKD